MSKRLKAWTSRNENQHHWPCPSFDLREDTLNLQQQLTDLQGGYTKHQRHGRRMSQLASMSQYKRRCFSLSHSPLNCLPQMYRVVQKHAAISQKDAEYFTR